MTSPVDTSVIFMKSTMSGAPPIAGTAGYLITALNAFLVNGWDQKTGVTLAVSAGGVATVTFTGTHSSELNAVIAISGVMGGPTGWANLNGNQKVTGRTTTTVTFNTTGVAAGTATGTINMIMAPCGWTQPFTGTNLATYQNAGLGMPLRVDDTGTTSSRVIGYETMSDVNTGTNSGFPTAAQMSGGGYWWKSAVASTAAAPYLLIGNSKFFMVIINASFTTSAAYISTPVFGFGDHNVLKPGGDAYGCALHYTNATTYNAAVGSTGDLSFNAISTTGGGAAFPRNPTGLGTCELRYCEAYTGNSAIASGVDTSLGTFPSGVVDGAMRMSKKATLGGTAYTGPRSEIPGLYHVPHVTNGVFNLFDTVPGAGALAGRTLIMVPTATSYSYAYGSTNMGVMAADITGPW